VLDRHTRFPYAGLSLGVGFLRFGPASSDWGPLAPAASPRWYGRQLMVADAMTAVVVPLFLLNRDPGDSDAPAFVFWGCDVSAAFVIHALHDHPGKAGASFALRVGSLGVAGMLAAQWRNPNPRVQGAAAAIGWLVSALIDDLVLARD
jgi:hypothetical protein